MFATSMPNSVAEAETKDLKPSMGRIRFLIVRWSCSTPHRFARTGGAPGSMFRYLTRTISIGIGQPNHFSMRLSALIPAVLAPLRSITIFRGRPFTSKALAKNLVAAVVASL